MKYTIVDIPSFQIMGVSRSFSVQDAMQKIPLFWDEYFNNGWGEYACGQFGYCYDEHPTEGHFKYAIGNRCDLASDGTLHIFNRPDRSKLPQGFELI